MGEIYLIFGSWLADNGVPNAVAQRIAAAKTAYGKPEWVEVGNWGGPHLTTALINLFHSVGIKVGCRIWSGYSANSLDSMEHSMDPTVHGGSVDYQMNIGPEIDAFMIDECQEDSKAYYKALIDYVHSKGKLCFVNPGGWQIRDWTPGYADMVSTEFYWREFIAGRVAMIAMYPTKFMGSSNEWGYNALGQTQYLPVNLARAVSDTLEAWNGGVYRFDSRVATETLPTWWETYLSQISEPVPPPPTGKTYVFDHWLINGLTSTLNPLQLAISTNVTIQAVYVEKVVTRTLTISATAGAESE